MINYLKKSVPKWIYWVGIISALSGTVVSVNQKIKRQAHEIRETMGFNDVLFGLLLAEMEPIDSLEYYTYYGSEKIGVKLRKTRWSNDTYVFVSNGRMWIYAGYYNNSEGKYNFTDFSGVYHLIYER